MIKTTQIYVDNSVWEMIKTTTDNSVVVQAVSRGLKALSSKYLLRMLSKLNTVQSRRKYLRLELIWVTVPKSLNN